MSIQSEPEPPGTCCLRDGQAAAAGGVRFLLHTQGFPPRPLPPGQPHTLLAIIFSCCTKQGNVQEQRDKANEGKHRPGEGSRRHHRESGSKFIKVCDRTCPESVGSKMEISLAAFTSSLGGVGDVPHPEQDWAALCCPRCSHHTFPRAPALHHTWTSATGGARPLLSPGPEVQGKFPLPEAVGCNLTAGSGSPKDRDAP